MSSCGVKLLSKIQVLPEKWAKIAPSLQSILKKKLKKKVVHESRSLLPSTSQGPDWCAIFLLSGTTLWLLKCVVFQEAADFLPASCSKCYYEIPHVFHAAHWQLVCATQLRKERCLGVPELYFCITKTFIWLGFLILVTSAPSSGKD